MSSNNNELDRKFGEFKCSFSQLILQACNSHIVQCSFKRTSAYGNYFNASFSLFSRLQAKTLQTAQYLIFPHTQYPSNLQNNDYFYNQRSEERRVGKECR